MIRWRAIATVVALLVTTPSVVMAHLVNSGLGPFYDGALHLLLSPGDLIGLVATALLAGLRGTRAGRLTILVLPAVWYLSGLIGLSLTFMLDLPWLSALSFVILGAMVALDPKLPEIVVVLLAGIYGALHGLLNGSALGVIGAGLLSLFGIVVTVLIIALLVSATVVSLRASWIRIAVRVAGSWVTAIGILMFGWLVRGTG